jgi:hypothetical protein
MDEGKVTQIDFGPETECSNPSASAEAMSATRFDMRNELLWSVRSRVPIAEK